MVPENIKSHVNQWRISCKSKFCKFSIFLGLLSLIILGNSCTEEIDLYSPPKTTPVVYALLDPDYDKQYIRVGESFSYYGEDSIIPKSNITYLDEEIEIYLTYTDDLGKNKIIWFSPHQGVVRDSGLFAMEELQVYSADMEVQLGKVYKFYLHLKESGRIVFGELKAFDTRLQVVDPLDVDFRTINLYTGEDFTFRFVPVSERAVYQSILTFNYNEIFEGVKSRQSMVFELDVVYGEENDVFIVEDRFSGENFLRELGRRLEQKEGMIREAIGLDFFISAGGEELYYLIKSEKQQFGFLARSTSNLLNGVGVFSSLSHRYIYDIKLSRHTIDSLALSGFTRHLGFQTFE